MDLVQVNHDWSCIEDESSEQSLCPEALGISDAFRDPELLPRIGDQYQVEIPSLMTQSAYLLVTEMTNDPTIFRGTSHDFLVGLPISLMWIKEEVKNMKHEHQEFPGDLNGLSSRNESIKHESITEMQIFPGGELQVKIEPMDITLNGVVEDREPAKLDEVIDLSNLKIRKYTFLILREEVLVSKTFGEGKILLEEYVSTLKATVGLNTFVEAVGIGKGKQDLTGIVMEPLKSNQGASVRPEIPVGKACSTLTPLEIVNFLTGGYRLSKARSNDLFWEAVWPRLLARGWHSEQPNDHGFAAASRHYLVFLIPGIKKFSRRKLVKGNHYFDSVTDVLNKVASDPALLELDVETDKGYGDKEEMGGPMIKFWTNKIFLISNGIVISSRELLAAVQKS
ncbi:hypothetical protein GH714_029343 [Hevea brasiliensis]|uniref:Uncharacterized protein n=1 Tax=Hevea brasiliensis TaxID=3981 RepID=A0A6A6KL56_HEVBR|nr:hypothetical protein GH714_029343 [Hevea brasiliensis]